jgi:hypothetical protein
MLKGLSIGVLYGGPSSEREVSIESGENVSKALAAAGHEIHRVLLDDSFTAKDARALGIDIAFLALHGEFGEDGRIQSILEEADIPYTGSGVDASSQAFDKMLAHDKKIRLAIEPKPNEPMDHAYLPTIGHALAIAQLTRDPKRVGCLIESAHAILAGLDPADEIDFAMAFNKLWSLHLNDQNGLKFDQDKPFGSSNLRVAFNQVRALERNGYGKNGEYVCFDVHPFRTTKVEHWLAHLDNSRRTFLRLVEKVRTFDDKQAQQLIAERNYAALDQIVLEHLMGR